MIEHHGMVINDRQRGVGGIPVLTHLSQREEGSEHDERGKTEPHPSMD